VFISTSVFPSAAPVVTGIADASRANKIPVWQCPLPYCAVYRGVIFSNYPDESVRETRWTKGRHASAKDFAFAENRQCPNPHATTGRKGSSRGGASRHQKVRASAFETAIARGASGYLRVVNTINPCVPFSQILLALLRGPAAQFVTSPPRLLKVVPRKPITERKIWNSEL